MKPFVVFVAVAALLAAVDAPAAGDLAVDGTYRIVIAKDLTKAEQRAAEQLKEYLKQITGGNLSIVSEADQDTETAIYVGPTRFATACGMNGYGNEEYHLKAVGKNLVIAGGRPRGVLFGTYEFLERFAGVRYLSANFEHVPQMAAVLVPGGTDLRHASPFIYRDIYPGHGQIPVDYRRKLRQNSGYGSPQYGFDERCGSPGGVHTLHKYSQDFPREISWMNRNGSRQIVNTPHSGSICFSQPEVLKRIAAKLKDHVKHDRARCDVTGAPYPRFYVVDMNDCHVECFCPQCQAIVREHDVSGLVIQFMNKLWEEVRDAYPDIYLMMFAYQDSTTPPRSDLKPKGNVVVRLAYMDHEFTESGKVKRDVMFPLGHPNNRAYGEALEQWHRCAPHLAIWDYWRTYRCGFQTPIHNTAAIPGLVRKYRDIGAKHVFVEMELGTTTPLPLFDLRYYLGAKMMNDPDLDDEELVEEFMAMFYGKAAAPMKEFKAYTEKRMAEAAGPLTSLPPAKRKFMDADYFKTLYSLLEQAEHAAAEARPIVENIRQERLVVDHAYLLLWNHHNNPLRLDKQALRQRIAEDAEIFGSKYFPDSWKDEREAAIEFFCDAMEFPEPKRTWKAHPLDGIRFEGQQRVEIGVNDLDGGGLVADADAFGGKAKCRDNDGKADYHARPFTFGLYEWNFKKHISAAQLASAEVPQDEKFHWYYAGRTRLYSEGTRLWSHWSWTLNFCLAKAFEVKKPKQLFDVYVSVKLQGPSYVRGSRNADEVRVDRLLLLKVDKDSPPLAQ
jgi:hypothetical protein